MFEFDEKIDEIISHIIENKTFVHPDKSFNTIDEFRKFLISNADYNKIKIAFDNVGVTYGDIYNTYTIKIKKFNYCESEPLNFIPSVYGDKFYEIERKYNEKIDSITKFLDNYLRSFKNKNLNYSVNKMIEIDYRLSDKDWHHFNLSVSIVIPILRVTASFYFYGMKDDNGDFKLNIVVNCNSFNSPILYDIDLIPEDILPVLSFDNSVLDLVDIFSIRSSDEFKRLNDLNDMVGIK